MPNDDEPRGRRWIGPFLAGVIIAIALLVALGILGAAAR